MVTNDDLRDELNKIRLRLDEVASYIPKVDDRFRNPNGSFRSYEEVREAYLVDLINGCNSVVEASKVSGIPPATLYRLRKKYKLGVNERS